MLLSWSRYTALFFAIGLGIGEAVINWGHWQFAPLWIVDYICVVWLLVGFYQARNGSHIATLLSSWAFTAGVFYMALFINLDPELAPHLKPDKTLLLLVGLMLGLALLGIVTSFLALRNSQGRE